MAPIVVGYTLELDDNLVQRVERALRAPLQRGGAMPVVLPRDSHAETIDHILDRIDGLLLSGGADVHPDHYGDDMHPETKVAPDVHDLFEIGLTRGALERGMPVLGICRGSQVLAVAAGGALVQDIPSQVGTAITHTGDWYTYAFAPANEHWHDLTVVPGSLAERWLEGGPQRVNSYHHQAVRDPGPILQATAWAPDGVIEATERIDGGGWAVGLQWHDEVAWELDARFLRPFDAFMEAVRARAGA